MKPWWDTRLCRRWTLQGTAGMMVMRRLIYVPSYTMPANDTDFIPW